MSATLHQYHQQTMSNSNQQPAYHQVMPASSYGYTTNGPYSQSGNYYPPAGQPGNANIPGQRYQQQPQSQPQQPQSQPPHGGQDQPYYPAPFVSNYLPGGSYPISQESAGYGGQVKYPGLVYPGGSYSESYPPSMPPGSQQHQVYGLPYGDNSQMRPQMVISEEMYQQQQQQLQCDLVDKNRLIKLARRKRTSRPKIGGFNKQGTARLLNTRQGRPLSPRTKIKLTLAPNLCLLYSLLVSDSTQHGLRILRRGNLDEYDEDEKSVLFQNPETKRNEYLHSSSLHTQVVVFTQPEGNVENTAESDAQSSVQSPYAESHSATTFASKSTTQKSSKQSYTEAQFYSSVKMEGNVPVYDDIDTSVKEIFGVEEFTLLRITRAAALEPEGAIVLKIETAKPGDQHLNDDDFDIYVPPTETPAGEDRDDDSKFSPKHEEESESLDAAAEKALDDESPVGEPGKFDAVLGKPGDPISCTFLKKKVARPRYKANMRIYVLPKNLDVVLYAQEKMLKRDLMNGTLNLDTDKRLILCAFDYKKILEDFDKGNIRLSSASILTVGENAHHGSGSIGSLNGSISGSIGGNSGAYTTGPLLPNIASTQSQSMVYQTQSAGPYSQQAGGSNQQPVHYYPPQTQAYQAQYSYYTTQGSQPQSQQQSQQQMMYPNYSLYGQAGTSTGVYQVPHQQ